MLNKIEIRRQVFHLCLGLIVIFLIYKGILTTWLIFLLIIIGGLTSLISTQIKLPVVDWFLKKFGREEEIKKFPGKGTIFFMVGVLLALKLFRQDIAFASIMILTLGDSVSHLVGEGVTGTNIFSNPKNLEGMLVGVLAGFIGALVFVNLYMAFFGALIAMLAETVELKMGGSNVDDNIIIPLVAGTVMYLIATNFQVFLM